MRRFVAALTLALWPALAGAQITQSQVQAAITNLPAGGAVSVANLQATLTLMNQASFQGLNGNVSISNSPTAGFVLAATSSTVAAWTNIISINTVNLGTSVSGTLSFPFNGTNLLTVNGGASSLLQLQVGGSVSANLAPKFNNFFPRTLFGDYFSNAWWGAFEFSQPFMFVQDRYGTGAISLVTRTSDWTATYPPDGSASTTQVVNNTILTVHDRTTSGPTAVWGTYSQFERTATAVTTVPTLLTEWSFHNLGSSAVSTPWNVNPSGYTIIARLDSGVNTMTGTAITSALDILNNGGCTPAANCGQMNAAINIGHDSVATVAGHIRAIMMPETYEVDWFHSDGTLSAAVSADGGGIIQLAAIAGVKATGAYISGGTTPTGNTGTCSTGVTVTGGAVAGTWTSTSICALAGTIILTAMPAAPTGYACEMTDRTTNGVTIAQTASSTTSATFTVRSLPTGSVQTVANDILSYKCLAY
jgi:hypothetical protein